MGRKSKRKKTINPQDRLSYLPDALLVEILSLLPIKSAVSTAALSRRWRTIWTQITSVTVDYHHFPDSPTFYSTVDHFFSQLTSPFVCTFSLDLDISVDFPSHVVDSWIYTICGRNVETIKVNADFNSTDLILGLNLPPFVFQSQSLVELQLFNIFEYEFPDVKVILPKLKMLVLVIPPSQCWVVAKLTRGCPSLQYMTLTGNKNWDEHDDVIIDIFSQSLKGLGMCFVHSPETTKFVINAPNLDCLYFDAGAGSSCSLVTKPSALILGRVGASSKTLALSLLKLVLSVRYMVLDFVSICALKDLKDGTPLIFSNLEYLCLVLFSQNIDELSWSPPDSMPASLFPHVKRIKIEISRPTKETHMLNLTKCLLISARVLEKFTFCVTVTERGNGERKKGEALRELAFCSELFKCQQSSSACQIEFSGKYVMVSANGNILRRADGRVMSHEELAVEINLLA